MRALALVGAVLLLGSCAAHRPPAVSATLEPVTAQLQPPADTPTTERPGLLRRLLGKPAPARTVQVITTPAGTQVVLPRKMRNSQLVFQQGTGNTNGNQASLGKNKGQAQQGTDSSSLVANTGPGQQQSQQGNGNHQQATQANVEPPGPLAVLAAKLAGPPGIVLGIVLLGGAIWAGWYFWYWVPARRKKEQPPTA